MRSPSLRTRPADADRARWLELLDRLDSERLAVRFVDAVRSVDDYRDPPIPVARLREDAAASFRHLVAALASGDAAATEPIATQVGVTRARAGIPLISLMSAIRIDFNLLWDALVGLGDADDAELLLRHAAVVWQVVDEYVQQTERAYLLEERRMADEITSVRRGLLAEALGDPRPTPARLVGIAEQLGLDPATPLTVYVGFDESVPPLRVAVADLERRGGTALNSYRGGALIVVVPQLEAAARERFDRLRIAAVECPEGFVGVPDASALGQELATVLEPGETGAMTPLRGWTRLLRRRCDGPASRILDLERDLAALGGSERASVLEAVASYLGTGSVTASAAELYCHRNTITNRLRRFEEVTGIDVTVPEQAARAVIALR